MRTRRTIPFSLSAFPSHFPPPFIPSFFAPARNHPPKRDQLFARNYHTTGRHLLASHSHTSQTRFCHPNQCSLFINYGHRFLGHTRIYNGITAHNQRASDSHPTDKLRSCPEHFTDGSRTENGDPNGQTTDRYGLATDSRSAHTRARNGLKTDEPSWGDRPTTDNQPAKPRNPHPSSTSAHTGIGQITNTRLSKQLFRRPIPPPPIPPQLYKCGGSRIIPLNHPTAFQRTEHGLRTDSARGGYPRRTGKSKRQKKPPDKSPTANEKAPPAQCRKG